MAKFAAGRGIVNVAYSVCVCVCVKGLLVLVSNGGSGGVNDTKQCGGRVVLTATKHVDGDVL